jgi:[ribosomal protein S5]-alanine N-acetyltransferase
MFPCLCALVAKFPYLWLSKLLFAMDFTLRPWRKSDLKFLLKYADNPRIAMNLTDMFPHPYTRKSGRTFLRMTRKYHPIRIFAIEVNGEVVGSIGLFPLSDIRRNNAEIGYWLAEPFWGKGIMTEAVKQMVEYGFKTFNINRIYAGTFGRNTGSQRVLEKAGFKFEARFEKTFVKNGELIDEVVYAFRKQA